MVKTTKKQTQKYIYTPDLNTQHIHIIDQIIIVIIITINNLPWGQFSECAELTLWTQQFTKRRGGL